MGKLKHGILCMVTLLLIIPMHSYFLQVRMWCKEKSMSVFPGPKSRSLEMITHFVLIQPKVSTSKEQILAFLQRVLTLQEVIPGILYISTGENRSVYHQGFTFGIIMRFVDEAHLQAHHNHPAHVAVVTELDRLCQQSIDFDLLETAK